MIMINKDVVRGSGIPNYFNTFKEYQHEYLSIN